MQQSTPAIERVVWTLLALALVGLTAIFLSSRSRKEAPAEAPVYGQVAEFTLTNQSNRAVSLADFRGKVWIADIIFTRCPGPCFRMTRAMRQLQRELPADGSVCMVSLTADPAFDTPEVLARYGARVEADFDRWHFLHGSKEALYDLAIQGLLLAVEEKQPEARESIADLFIHSTRFVVVDKQGRIRGMFDGSDPVSTAAVRPLVESLRREP